MRNGERGGVSTISSSSGSAALNALTLQALQDQQHIIERQRELVATLKARVAELEEQQTQRVLQAAAAPPPATQPSPASSKAYVADVKLRRRLTAAEAECASLKARAAQLQSEVASARQQLEAQQLLRQRQETAWQERVAAMAMKAGTTAKLINALDQRNVHLTDQTGRLRREVDVRVYEVAQWRSLTTMVVPLLSAADSRYAKEQVALMEENVRRYAARHAAAADATAAGVDLDDDGDGSNGDGGIRSVWSRTAQSPHSSTLPASRFRSTMNNGGSSKGVVGGGGTLAKATTTVNGGSVSVEAAHSSA